MQKSLGRDPYDNIWDYGGIVDISFYVGFGVGTITLVTGAVMAGVASKKLPLLNFTVEHNLKRMQNLADNFIPDMSYGTTKEELLAANTEYLDSKKAAESMNRVSTAGKLLMGIGGALMVMSAVLKGAQI